MLYPDYFYIVTPSNVVSTAEPSITNLTRVDRRRLTESAKKGIAMHKEICLQITHLVEPTNIPAYVTQFVRAYPSPISNESGKSVILNQNVKLKATVDVLAGTPQNGLCLEIKPGKSGQPYGGVKGRYVLQAVLNGLAASSGNDYPDVALYLYNSQRLITLDKSTLSQLLPQIRQMAISTGRLLYLEKQDKRLSNAGKSKLTAPPGQLCLFPSDQLSPEYLSAPTELPLVRQAKIDERRHKFDPSFYLFMSRLPELIQ